MIKPLKRLSILCTMIALFAASLAASAGENFTALNLMAVIDISA